MNSQENALAPAPVSPETPNAVHSEEKSAEKPDKTPSKTSPKRRIGTITMGLSLIVTGVVIFISLLIPEINMLFAAKFAPLILVFLGIEILWRTITAKGEKIRYDFLSGFVCMLLIVASVAVSIIPSVLRYYGPWVIGAQNRMEDIVYRDVTHALDNTRQFTSSTIPVTWREFRWKRIPSP